MADLSIEEKAAAYDALVEAMSKIAALAPKGYEAGAEHWTWGNFDDSYSYGYDGGLDECARIAAAAVAAAVQAARRGGEGGHD